VAEMKKTVPPMLAAVALLAFALPSRSDTPAVDGIPNFHQVTKHIYRGGQPDPDSWAQLAKLGVKAVVDLRRPGEHSTAEESTAVHAAGMRYVNFPMNGFATPTHEQMATVLPLLDGPDHVFVHCKQGRDRTGSVIAAYRISRQSWENTKALAEAIDLGMHWYEAGMKRFIASYRAAPDIAKAASSTPVVDNAVVAGADSATAVPSELAR